MAGERQPGGAASAGANTAGASGATQTRFVHDEHAPVFVISVAAQLAGMHAQTLRQYDRLGIVSPQRTRGGGRRYSSYDVAKLREVQRLSQEEGVSLAGISRIMSMADEIERLGRRVDDLEAQVARAHGLLGAGQRVFAAGRHGDVVAVRPGQRPRRDDESRALMLWRPTR